MDFTKSFLTDTLDNDRYSDIVTLNTHSGPHHTMIFPHKGLLYRIQYIEGREGEPRWLSAAGSTVANCEAVKRVTQKVVTIDYIPVTDIEYQIPTPCNTLDFHL